MAEDVICPLPRHGVSSFVSLCLRAFYVAGRCQAPSVPINRSRGVAAEQTAHPKSGPRRRRRAPARADARAHTLSSRGSGDGMSLRLSARLLSGLAVRARGPQRLCSLNPDTSAAVPPSWRSRLRPCTTRTHSARETRTCRAYAPFNIAPCGTTPAVTYRHRAITSFRATATIPMRRARWPLPKFARYQRVSALSGCHRTQFQAS
jgi:hypothetical protein